MKKITFLIFMFLPVFSYAQLDIDNEPYIIEVKGEFITRQKPENIIVSLEITETDSDYKKCFDKAFATLNALKTAFLKNGIAEKSVKTKDLSINEDYDWDNNKRIKKGYIAIINMEIENTYNEEFTRKLLKSLSEYTFKVNYNIGFVLSEEQKEKLRETAIKESVNDARKKAEIIARASNLQLGEIYRINYGNSLDFGNNIDNDLVKDETVLAIASPKIPDREIDFNPKEIAIKKTILIEWKIKQ